MAKYSIKALPIGTIIERALITWNPEKMFMWFVLPMANI